MFYEPLKITTGLTVGEGELNAGGLARLMVCPARQVRVYAGDGLPMPEMTDFVRLRMDGRGIFIPYGISFTDIGVLLDSASVSESPAKTENGQYTQVTISLDFPKDRQEATGWLWQFRDMGLVAIGTDRNGVSRLYGTDRTPLYLNSSGANSKARNGRSVTLSGSTTYPPFYIPDLTQLLTIGDFNDDFSNDFF